MDDSALIAGWVSRLQGTGFAPERAALIAEPVMAIVEGVRRAAADLPFDAEPATFVVALNEG